MNYKRLILLVTGILLVVLLLGGGYLVMQKAVHDKGQADAIKAANESYKSDVRYVSFGADYIFAVPKSFGVDESSVNGVQLVVPAGSNLKVSKLEELYDAAVVAVQPITQAKPNDNGAFIDYINKTVVPDLKKDGSTVTVDFVMPGKYKGANINVKKDGKQSRQLFAYGGAHPYMVVAKDKSDAFVEVANTLLPTADSKYKDDIAAVAQSIKTTMTLLQQGQIQQLYDGASSTLKKQTTANDLTKIANDESTFIHRNIVALGGSFQGNHFFGQLLFQAASKDEAPSSGSIALQKDNSLWLLEGINLPVPPAAPPKKS